MRVLRGLLLCALCAVCVFARTDDALKDALARIAKLEERLDDRQNGEILWFTNRADCPAGYYPMESAAGRLVVIGTSDDRGKVTMHSLQDQHILTMPCKQTIGVAENGAQTVCHSDDDGATVVVDLESMLPYAVMMACSRENPPQPVIP